SLSLDCLLVPLEEFGYLDGRKIISGGFSPGFWVAQRFTAAIRCGRARTGRARLHSLRKNSDSDGVRKGHEFTRAAKSLKMCPRFSARGELFPQASSVVPRTGQFSKSVGGAPAQCRIRDLTCDGKAALPDSFNRQNCLLYMGCCDLDDSFRSKHSNQPCALREI